MTSCVPSRNTSRRSVLLEHSHLFFTRSLRTIGLSRPNLITSRQWSFMISSPESFSKVRNATMPPVRDLVSQTLASFSYLLLSLFVHIQCNGLLFPRDLNDLHAGDSPQLPDTPHTFLHITLRSLLSIAIVSVAGPLLASVARGNIMFHDADSITTCASFELLICRQLQKMCYMFPAFLASRTFTSPLRSSSWVKALVTLDVTKISWWSERVFWLALMLCAGVALVK